MTLGPILTRKHQPNGIFRNPKKPEPFAVVDNVTLGCVLVGAIAYCGMSI
jgi:hypothetical protein